MLQGEGFAGSAFGRIQTRGPVENWVSRAMFYHLGEALQIFSPVRCQGHYLSLRIFLSPKSIDVENEREREFGNVRGAASLDGSAGSLLYGP